MKLDMFTLDVILDAPINRISLELIEEIKAFLKENGIGKE